MKTFSLIATLITGLAVSSFSMAGTGHGHEHGQAHNNIVQVNNRSYDNNRSYNRSYNHRNHGNRSRSNRSYRNYGRRGNYRGFNSPYRQGQGQYRDYSRHDYRRGHNNYRRNHRYYNNYRPYRTDRYRYRPTRGLGHYFVRDNFGYGHWHDGMWCDVYHPASFYVDYYGNYPYSGGWAIGDGDFGIHFYLN